MTETATDLTVAERDFELLQRKALAIASGDNVPKHYAGKNNVGNVMLAIEVAQRTGFDLGGIMQSSYVVHGNFGWRSDFIIALLNHSKKFPSDLKFRWEGEGNARSCEAYVIDRASGEIEAGPKVSIETAIKSGWTKGSASWANEPDVMLAYRAATRFGRLYAPEIMLGMKSIEEINDGAKVINSTSEFVSVKDVEEEKTDAERVADFFEGTTENAS